jgi:hypothetical protein
MLWKELDFTKIDVEHGRAQRQKFTYRGEPLRFQLPEGLCVNGLSEYNQISIEVSPEFQTWFRSLEAHIGVKEPWNSILNEGFLNLKLDESAQVFDSDKKLTNERTQFQGCMIKCIIEICGLYFFKDTYGLTCRVYQLLSSEVPCLFE